MVTIINKALQSAPNHLLGLHTVWQSSFYRTRAHMPFGTFGWSNGTLVVMFLTLNTAEKIRRRKKRVDCRFYHDMDETTPYPMLSAQVRASMRGDQNFHLLILFVMALGNN